MPRHASDPELKAEFAAHIGEILSKATAREVAGQLGVKVQMVYNYRKGKNAPSPEVIRRAMEKWPFPLSYRGKTFTLSDFGTASRRPRPARPSQFELWEAIKKLEPKSVKIEILEKRTASVRLGVRISFSAK